MVCTVDLGPIDRNVYNVGALIDDDYISISTYILNGHTLFPHIYPFLHKKGDLLKAFFYDLGMEKRRRE